MADLLTDVAQLAADLRALLGDEQARGVRAEARGAVTPGLSTPPPDDRPAPVGSWSSTARGAREAGATGAGALRTIRDELGDCRRCGLCKTRKNIVFGAGSPQARLVVVGEGPGHKEDLKGEPFVGPAGQMLEKMLTNVLGLQREQVYIVNVVKCRPPDNRNPLPEEVAACMPFLEAQLKAIQPEMLLVLGTVAFKNLMRTSTGITRSRGRWHVYRVGDLEIPVMPTFHPAYLLRNPADKRKTFEDLKAIRARLDA